jgi:hypothetical protein
MNALRAATALPVLAVSALLTTALFAGGANAQEGGQQPTDSWIANWAVEAQQNINETAREFRDNAGKPIGWGPSPTAPASPVPVTAPPPNPVNSAAESAPAIAEPDAAQEPGSNDIDTASQYGAESSTSDSGDGSSWPDSYGNATPGDAAAPASDDSGGSWGSGGEDGGPASGGGTGDDCHAACTVQ